MFNKKYKDEIKKLEEKNRELQQQVYTLQRNREINKDLYNMVKAMMKQLNLEEIEIEDRTIKYVEHLELYVTDSHMKFAKIIRLFDNQKDVIKIDEF